MSRNREIKSWQRYLSRAYVKKPPVESSNPNPKLAAGGAGCLFT